MKSKDFRQEHGLALLAEWDEGGGPLDLQMSRYFRRHKALGSKDRRAIGEKIYGMVRRQVLIEYLVGEGASWAKRWEVEPADEGDLPRHVRCSMPEELFDLLAGHYGEERAEELGHFFNERAPTTIRVNTLKTTREALLAELGGRACEGSPVGMTFDERVQLMGLPSFRAGYFELQDEGSQQVAALVGARPGEVGLDYCAGSGGKALALAADMENRGQLYLHDVRRGALHQAKLRLRRAGAQNTQVHLKMPGAAKGKMDFVLVDAPCTGSGTWRRNPEMKNGFTLDQLHKRVNQQREIVAQALVYLKRGGRLIYATCSLFPEENEEQVVYFEEKLGLNRLGEPLQIELRQGGPDAFFAAVLQGPQ